MKTQILFLLATVQISTTAMASGQCIAQGRVGGEEKVCAGYKSQQSCENKDKWAWCKWRDEKPQNEVLGTGPLHVTCTQAKGEVRKYNVNDIFYSQESNQLAAIGFGPNRQDDGMALLEGNCQISLNPEGAR